MRLREDGSLPEAGLWNPFRGHRWAVLPSSDRDPDPLSSAGLRPLILSIPDGVDALQQRADRVANWNRNILIFPNLVINDIMGLTVRTFQPVTPGYLEVNAVSLAPRIAWVSATTSFGLTMSSV